MILESAYSRLAISSQAANEGGHILVTFAALADSDVRALTYERRATLLGRLGAARRLADRRGLSFDARAWWQANRPPRVRHEPFDAAIAAIASDDEVFEPPCTRCRCKRCEGSP